MKKIFFYLSIILLLSSCATFKNDKFIDNKLKTSSLDLINGTYNNLPFSGDGSYVRSLTNVFDRNTNMFDFKEKYEKKDLKIILKAINQNRLNVKIYEAENLLFDKNLKVKLKHDGFIYLKEKRFMLDGILLIFGGWNIQKSRFRIDENNNLHLQSNYFFCNGILIVMSDWKTFHYNLTFEKTL